MTEMIDIHAHILWGVDDGPETFEESCAILKDAASQGLIAAAVTPHYFRHSASPSDRKKLSERLQRLQNVFPQLELVLGQELHWHEDLPQRIRSGAALSYDGGRYVLVEFEPGDAYEHIRRGLRRIMETGRIPVLAHAERYSSLDPERFRELKSCGVLIQLNYESLLGSFFSREARRCRSLVKAGLVDLLASDVHDQDGRAFRGAETAALCEKLVGRKKTKELMELMPAKIAGFHLEELRRPAQSLPGRTFRNSQ